MNEQEKPKKEFFLKRAFKAMFYNEDRTKFSRSTLGFIICMVVALGSVIIGWTIIIIDFFAHGKINVPYVGIITGHTVAVTGGSILNYFGGKKIQKMEEPKPEGEKVE